MAQKLVFRGTRQELHQLLGSLGAAAHAGSPAAKGLQLRLGVALLSQIQQDYIVKSRGGTGKDGIRWAPLKPSTIARRRKSKADKVVARTLQLGSRRKLRQEELYGQRVVDILRDTGRLLRSFSPGVEDRPSSAAEQVFDTPSGAVIVGTNVPYATAHQHGNPARNLPARPILPVGGVIPAAYWPALRLAAVRGVVRLIELLLQRRRP